MLLLSKTVTNHLRSNLFSTTVITFFAGCSAFVQISTDNIKGIIDASLSPYSALPRNDIFIKTGKPEPYMGGASFTVPVEVTVKDAEVKPDGPKEIRIITPLGWFTTFEHKLAVERASKVSQTKADYGGDYCIPMTGLRSIYTNYYVRPHIRFKGIWDAEIKGAEPLVPKENKTYRRECAEYVEERPIDEEFLGKLMHDYIANWFEKPSEKTEGEGLVAFVKGNEVPKESTELTTDNLEKTLTPFLQEQGNTVGPRSNSTNRVDSKNCHTSIRTAQKPWCGAQTIYDNSGKNEFGFKESSSIRFSGKTNLDDKIKAPKSGIFGGWKKKNENSGKVGKLEFLAGTKSEELQTTEYLRKHQERRKSKLKIDMEAMLLNSEHMDVRKILDSFRNDFEQTQLVLTQASESQEQNTENNPCKPKEGKGISSNLDLFEPVEKNPWLNEAANRQMKRNSQTEVNSYIYNKWRTHQDNQLLRKKESPCEKDMLKFSVHRSVQLSNIGLTQVSSSGKDNTFDGHSFKVIAYEDEQERGIVNPIKIIKGNQLFRARENQEQLLKDFIRNFDEPFYSPSMIPMLRMISRANFSDKDLKEKQQRTENAEHQKYEGVRETLHWWIDYLQYPWRDTWNISSVKAKQFDPIMYTRLQLWLEEIFKRTWSSNGSRIIFNFTAPYEHLVLGKLVPQLKIPINNFKTIGYIDQPTASFTVVSPEYARIHNLEPISDEQYKQFRERVNNLWLYQETWENYYNEFIKKLENKKHLVNVGEKQMIIVGIGQTPDLLYPVQSWLTLQPDKTKEALIYVDNYGFNDLKERGTIKYQEQYINVRLPENIMAKGPEAIKAYREKLTQFIDQKLTDKYKNYYHLTVAGAPEGSNQLYSIRSSYVPTFQSRVGAVSYVLSSAVYVVVLILLLILIKKYLKSNLYLFGNFVANGMIKVDVLLNICLFALIPLALATTMGFLLSWAMQSSFYSIISAFWYLTVQMNPLGATSALYFILKVLAFMIPIFYFYSKYTLKDNVSALLKTTASMKVNKGALLIYRLIHKVSTLWKFKSVLVFNTLGQSGILTMTSAIGFIFLNFFLHNHGQFKKVSEAEKIVKAHEFEMDFETPTQQAGEYNLATYEEIGTKVSAVATPALTSARPSGQDNSQKDKYYILNYREKDLLEKIWESYKGKKPQWLNGDKNKCELTTIQSSSGDGHARGDSVSQGKVSKVAKFNGLFCLKKVGKSEEATSEGTWELHKPTSSSGEEDYYIRDQKIYKGDKTLKQLLEQYPNYWFISSRDQGVIETAIDFFKHKTLLRIFLDLDFEFHSESGFQKYNIWNQQSKELEKIQPMLQKMDEKNYDDFIQDLVKSKYGPLFVAKFMKKHDTIQGIGGGGASAEADPSKLLARQGDIYQGKKSWYFKGDQIGREWQKSNKRKDGWTSLCMQPTQGLKKGDAKKGNCDVSGSGGGRTRRETSSSGNENKAFEDGIYHLDVGKIVYFNDAPDVDKDLFVVYNPEFLYLIITAIEDFSQLREKAIKEKRRGGEYTLPIKYTFGNIVHSSDPTFNKDEKKSESPEYYSSTMKKVDGQTFDPSKTPQGDQTYTWANGDLRNGGGDTILSPDTRIVGLKEDARGSFYKLYSKNQLINGKLYEGGVGQQVSSEESTGPFPIIINKFAARKHNLREGDTITFTPKNHFTRYTCQLQPKPETGKPEPTTPSRKPDYCNLESEGAEQVWKNTKIKPYTLKVVGIFDSFYQEAYFMSQKDLNTVLGLNPDKGFNGIFSPKREGRYPDQLSVSLSSYSVSGIYTNLQQKVGNNAFTHLLRSNAPFKEANQKISDEELKNKSDEEYSQHKNYKIFLDAVAGNEIGYSKYLESLTQASSGSLFSSSSTPNTKSRAQREGEIEGEVQKIISRVSQTFSEYPNPIATALRGLMNHGIVGDVVFNNLSNLTDNVSYLVIFVIFPLLLMSLITIVYLLIKDLENVFVTMKLLGFGTKENSMPIIVYLLFLFVFSSFIGSLILPSVLGKYVDILFNSQSILLPLIASNGLMAGVFAILGAIYLFSIFKSYVKIKGIYLPISIKLLVG